MRMTYVLILANFITFALGLLWPLGESNAALLLYGFSHQSALHLLFNMLALLTFGLGVERVIGAMPMLVGYVAALMVGAVFHLMWGSGLPVVGASAGIYALIVMYAMHNRGARVLFLVLPMKAQTLGILAVAVELLMVATGWLPNIAHYAHLGGAFAGFWLYMAWGFAERLTPNE